MRCRKECEEKHRQDRHTPPCHVAVPPCHAAQPVHGRARESSPSPPLKSLVPGMCKNILQKSFPSPFLQILSKSNSSVSIILERPTLHPIQTTHLFPVLICKLFRDYLFFLSFTSPPPFLFPVAQAESQANKHIPAPWDLPGPKPFPILFSCLHLSRTSTVIL